MRPETGSVVVVGGANMDIKAHSTRPAQLHTSNPGSAATSVGGVGHNVAEGLARLGTPTHLVAAVGNDSLGEQVRAGTRRAGVSVDHMITLDATTGTYLAVIDSDGELLVAVADMGITDSLTVRHLGPARDLIACAGLLVIDGNLPAGPAGWLLRLAAAAGVPVVLDPVSVPKAGPLADVLSPQCPVLALTPNHDELVAILGAPVPATTGGISRAARALHDRGVEHVWVRRGTHGSLLSSRGADGRVSVTTLAAPEVTAVDVTGAGDAMTAAFVHALLRGDSPPDAARFGQMAAALTAASPETVRPDLTSGLVDAELRARARPGATKEGTP